jgi:hypothetical protein
MHNFRRAALLALAGTAFALTAVSVSKLAPGQLLPRAPMWRSDSSEVAFSLSSLRTFADVFSVYTRTGKVERWTKGEFGAFDPDTLTEPEIVRWKSFDGVMISGILYRRRRASPGRGRSSSTSMAAPEDPVLANVRATKAAARTS